MNGMDVKRERPFDGHTAWAWPKVWSCSRHVVAAPVEFRCYEAEQQNNSLPPAQQLNLASENFPSFYCFALLLSIDARATLLASVWGCSIMSEGGVPITKENDKTGTISCSSRWW